MKATLFVVTSIFALAVSACSSSTDDTGGTTTKKDSGTDGAATETGGGSDTGVTVVDTGMTTTETGGGDDACLMESGSACIQCCAMNHPDGASTYQSTVQACACKDTTCKSACSATFCAAMPKSADSACDACLKGTAAMTDCGMALGTACTGDCKSFYDCASKCPM